MAVKLLRGMTANRKEYEKQSWRVAV